MNIRFILFVFLILSLKGLSQNITTLSINASTDTHIDNVAITTNYNSTSPIVVSSVANGASMRVKRILLTVNLATLPSNAVITEAYWELSVSGVETNISNTSLKIERIDPIANPTMWTSSTVTWSNQPTTVTHDAVSSSTLIGTTRLFYITEHIQKMRAGIYQNYGWMIKLTNENMAASGSYTTISNTIKPKLVIKYYLPFSVNAATVSHSSSNQSANGSIWVNITGGPSSPSYQWYSGNSHLQMLFSTSNTISNLNPGWYGLRVTGTTGEPLYMAFLVGVKCQNFDINFNPSNNGFYFDDAVTTSLFNELNQGNSVINELTRFSFSFGLGFPTSFHNTKTFFRPRIWFDQNVNYTNANLLLKGSNHNFVNRSNVSEFNKVTSPWNENNIAWSNMPTHTTVGQIVIPATTTTTENKNIDLSTLCNEWKLNNSLNYGGVFQLQSYSNPTAGMTFHSSDVSTSSNKPSIQFTLNLENLAGCSPASIDDISFSVLKEKLDAGFTTTFDKKFKFSFFEENTINTTKFVPFEIINQNNEVVASSNFNGVVSGNVLAIPYASGINTCTLDITNVSGLTVGSFFTLVVTNVNNEKMYLKIFYKN